MHKTCLGYVAISSSAPRPLGAAYIPILLSDVEQEQRPSGNGDREAIVVGARLCDGEGERAYTGYAPHIIRHISNYFSLRLYNVVNSVITDRKMYRCMFKVSFYFRGSLYEINVLLTLFLQIEVSI